MMTFRKRGGRRKKEQRYWNETEIEEINHFKYIGYMLQRNNGADRHIKESQEGHRCYETNMWNRTKEIYRGKIYFKKRMWMFNDLVKSIILWRGNMLLKEYKTVKRCQDKYIKWSLALDWDTLGYIVREETKIQAMRIESGKRALNFKEKEKNIV